MGEEANREVLEEVRRQLPYLMASPDGEITSALAETGLAGSKTEARRLLADGAISINGERVTREHFEANDFSEWPSVDAQR